MKINKRERIALGVFSTALVALAVDKLLLPEVAPAEAAAVESPARSAPGMDATTLLRAPQPPTSAPASVSDVFAWSRLGLIARSAPQTAVAAESDVAFETRHKLDGVVLGPRPAAVISGRVVRLGEILDGYRLDAIENDGVTFVADQQRVTLTLQRPKTRR